MPAPNPQNRQKIIATADRLFYQSGYHQTAFSDIVNNSGVARGNIYYHFKTKQALLTAVIEARLTRIKTLLDDWNGRYRTPVQRLHRFVNTLHDHANSLPYYGCPLGSLNTELGKTQPALQKKAKALLTTYEGWLTDQFAELGYAGKAQELALRCLALGQGISLISHAYRDVELLQRERLYMLAWIDRLAAGKDECI